VKAAAGTLSGTHRLAELAGRESTLVFAIGFWLALIQISIAASQIVLTFVLLLWLYQLAVGKAEMVRLPLDWPLGLFAVFSIASAIFSFEPAESFASVKKLTLLAVPYLMVSAVRRTSTLERLVLVLIVVADIGALFALWQYFFGDLGDINHRIRGFMSHYMTFAGLLMGVSVLAFAQLLFHPGNTRTQKRGRRAFLSASLVLILVALALSLTRSAWIGVLVSASLLCFLRDKRLLIGIPILLFAAAALVPKDVEMRVRSFVRPDRSGRDRVYMLQSGLQMSANHPWFGVGPNMVKTVYPIYRLKGAPQLQNIHLHNNVVQIAAERGIPCLAAWTWLMAVGIWWSIKAYRHTPSESSERALSAGVLALLVAGMTAGLFEYNFGDSEFLMLFLLAMAIPITLERNRTTASPAKGATS
jgi:O-antigen ligase